MGLFDKVKKEKAKTSGSIPEGLGITHERADEIIRAVRDSYKEENGNINTVIDVIKAEKLKENEAIFAYYAMGAIKVKEEGEIREGLDGLLATMRKLKAELED